MCSSQFWGSLLYADLKYLLAVPLGVHPPSGLSGEVRTVDVPFASWRTSSGGHEGPPFQPRHFGLTSITGKVICYIWLCGSLNVHHGC